MYYPISLKNLRKTNEGTKVQNPLCWISYEYSKYLFTSDDHYLLLALIGKGRRTNLLLGNLWIANGWLGRAKKKQAVTQERKLFSEICKL